jgi:hypothetical protein
VAASRSTELVTELPRALWRELRGLGANERLAALGVATMLVSLLLPWFGVPIGGDLVQTGLGAFSFAEGALVVTALAILFLLLQLGGGYVPPRPLREWGLLVVAGSWAALIVIYRMFDRPDFHLGSLDETYDLRYGIFVALAGAAIVIAAGLRLRPRERSERPEPPS